MRSTVRCLVWDLDDILWRGDGALPPVEVVRTLHALDRLGVLHAGIGRRDPRAVLERHGLAEMFAVLSPGRSPGPDQLRLTASAVDTPVTGIAVVTGDPMVRAAVAAELPQVRCYPASMVPALPDLPEFTPAVVTSQTRDQRRIFRAEQHRLAAAAAHPGTAASFLATLDLELAVRPAYPSDLAAVTRFTATGRALAEAELVALVDRADHQVLVATMSDRFGPYGMVGMAVLASVDGSTTSVELLMCDRVLARGTATAFLEHIVWRSMATGRVPVAEFVPTTRNRQLLVALRFSGFVVTARTGEKITLTFDPAVPAKQHHPVRVVAGQ